MISKRSSSSLSLKHSFSIRVTFSIKLKRFTVALPPALVSLSLVSLPLAVDFTEPDFEPALLSVPKALFDADKFFDNLLFYALSPKSMLEFELELKLEDALVLAFEADPLEEAFLDLVVPLVVLVSLSL